MNKQKIFLLFLIFLIIYVFLLFNYGQTKLWYFVGWDGAMRAVWAAAFREVFFDFLKGDYHSLSDIYTKTISSYVDHYSAPLYFLFMMNQLFIYILIFFSIIFGNSYFTLMLPNLIFTVIGMFFLYKIVYTLHDSQKIAFLTVFLYLLYPFVFTDIFGLNRGTGETMFLLIFIFYILRFLRDGKGKYLMLSFLFLWVGFWFRESMIIFFPVFFIMPFLREGFLKRTFSLHKKVLIKSVIIIVAVFSLLLFAEYFFFKFGFSGTFYSRIIMGKLQYGKKEDIDGFLTLREFFRGISAGYYSYRTPYSLPVYKLCFLILSTIFYYWHLAVFFILGFICGVRNISERKFHIVLSLILVFYLALFSLFDFIPEYSPPVYAIVCIFVSKGVFILIDKFSGTNMRIVSMLIFLVFQIIVSGIALYPSRGDNIVVSDEVAKYVIRRNESEVHVSVLTEASILRRFALSLLLESDKKSVYLVSPENKTTPAFDDYNKLLSSNIILTARGRRKPEIKFVITSSLTNDLARASFANHFAPVSMAEGSGYSTPFLFRMIERYYILERKF